MHAVGDIVIIPPMPDVAPPDPFVQEVEDKMRPFLGHLFCIAASLHLILVVAAQLKYQEKCVRFFCPRKSGHGAEEGLLANDAVSSGLGDSMSDVGRDANAYARAERRNKAVFILVMNSWTFCFLACLNFAAVAVNPDYKWFNIFNGVFYLVIQAVVCVAALFLMVTPGDLLCGGPCRRFRMRRQYLSI